MRIQYVQNQSVTTDFRRFQPPKPSSSAYKTTLSLQFFGLYEVDKGLHQLHAETKAYVAEMFYNQLSVIDSVTYIRTYVCAHQDQFNGNRAQGGVASHSVGLVAAYCANGRNVIDTGQGYVSAANKSSAF